MCSTAEESGVLATMTATDPFQNINTPAQERPFPKAMIYAWRGENDSAFESLKFALEQYHSGLANILINDPLKHLEGDLRYPALFEKLDLLEAWKAMPPE